MSLAVSPSVLDLSLPEALEAHEPPEARGLARDGVRLLVSRKGYERLEHARFRDLPNYLRPGDLLVLNVSATLPAALTARRADGSEVALHVSTALPADLHVIELRKVTASAREPFSLPGGGSATALVPYPDSNRLWVARLELPEPLLAYLDRYGKPITYPYVPDRWPLELYQNVYASVPGSAEMASAGRPFTAELMDRLALEGVFFASVVLHAGVSSLEHDEPPHEEYFEVPHEAAAAIERARKGGHRVIAVGTTVVRALESSVDAAGRTIASRGWTDKVIGPETGVTVADGLLTGFHEPKASHLALLEAFLGHERLEHDYRAAMEAGYLWHEFGDLHLILPD
jgi:S-adenosylmethionine:tRNA ribosyltransferase-isomerase